jgi:hypothetical protein
LTTFGAFALSALGDEPGDPRRVDLGQRRRDSCDSGGDDDGGG